MQTIEIHLEPALSFQVRDYSADATHDGSSDSDSTAGKRARGRQ